MTAQFEVVGVLDADVADVVAGTEDDQTILVEHDDPSERLVARPKDGDAA